MSLRGGKGGSKRRRASDGTRRRRVRVGAADASLTPCAGLAAVSETDRVLGLVKALDAHIPSIKVRDRGLSGGQVLVSMASCQLAGGDHLVSLDRRRARYRRAGAGTGAHPGLHAPPPRLAQAVRAPTAGRDRDRDRAGQRQGAASGRAGAPRRRCGGGPRSTSTPPTWRCTGRSKQDAAYNYQGAAQPTGRDIALWAELGVPLAADLLAGNDDPRASVVELIRTRAREPAGRDRAGRAADGRRLLRRRRRDRRRTTGDRVRDRGQTQRRGLAGHDRRSRTPRTCPVIGMDDTEVAVIPYAPRAGRAGHRTAWPDAPASAQTPSRPTRGPASAAPSPRTSSPWPWTGRSTTCTGTPSS